MTSVNRHRTEEIHWRDFAVDSATVIEAGDAIWLDADDAKPASDVGWDSAEEADSEANCRKYFAARFGGVALDASPSGKAEKIRVGWDGEWEFPCESATFEIGDLFGPAGVDSPLNLADQSLLKVADPRQACFMATRPGASATTVHVRPLSGAERAFLMSQVHTEAFGEVDLTGTNTLFADYNFGKRVRLLELQGIVTTAIACDTTAPVFSLYKVAQVLDDALTFVEGDAVGTVRTQTIDDATGDDVFEAETDCDGKVSTAAADSSSAAGKAFIKVVYMDLGANKGE